MSSSHFGIKAILVAVAMGVLVGCSQMNSKPQNTTSFAQTPACVNNSFLQKYNCDTENIAQAAETGDPDAQYALGYLHYYGVGVPQDEQTALLWIRKAAAQDQPLAKQALLIMEKSSLSTESSVNNSSLYPSPSGSYSDTTVHNAASTNITSQKSASTSATSINSQLPQYGQPATTLTSPTSNGPQATPPAPNPSSATPAPAIDMLQSSDASPQGASVPPQPIAANNESQTDKIQHTAPKFTADERYLLSVKPSAYTIELMGSHTLQSILDFIQANQLSGQVNYYKIALQNKPWYILIYGHYLTKAAAQTALANLSVAVRAQTPWVRSFAEIQQDIKQTPR